MTPRTSPPLDAARAERPSPGAPPNRPFDLLDVLLGGDPKAFTAARARVRAEASAREDGQRLVRAAEAALSKDPALLGFDETGFGTLAVAGRVLSAGRFATPTLGELRRRLRPGRGRVSVAVISGADPLSDIGALQAFAGERTLFQVASQFNCLEAPGPNLTQVANYFTDPTQGPRASLSAFPGTLLRHYAAPAADGTRFVQTGSRQLDLLGRALPSALGSVKHGYLLTNDLPDLAAAARALEDNFEEIAVGVHEGVQVVFGGEWTGPVPAANRIAQVFTSTLAVSYGRSASPEDLDMLCRPLLRAAYLGTLLAAASLGKERVVLTLIGGGVFGNSPTRIWDGIFWAADEAAGAGAHLDVVVNAHSAGVPREAQARCAERGGAIIKLG